MTVTANILLSSKDNVLTVPSGSITEQDGVNYVKILKNGKMQLIPVETGTSSDTLTEIKSGVSAGEKVITGNGQTNNPGRVVHLLLIPDSGPGIRMGRLKP